MIELIMILSAVIVLLLAAIVVVAVWVTGRLLKALEEERDGQR